MEEKKRGTMHLLNNFPVCGIQIPSFLDGKITILSTCELTDICKEIYNKCLLAVAEQLEYENIRKEDLENTNVVFSMDGNYNLQMESITLGFHVDFCFYNLSAISLDKENDEILIVGCFVEELAHHYWRIDDEIEVKYKIYDILKHIYPDVTIEHILGGLY